MSVIVTCSCSARVRLPEVSVGRRVRCPSCQAELVPPGEDNQSPPTPAGPKVIAAGETCPICQSAIGPGEVTLACPDCKQVHHRECWADVGGCSTYGCPRMPAL